MQHLPIAQSAQIGYHPREAFIGDELIGHCELPTNIDDKRLQPSYC